MGGEQIIDNYTETLNDNEIEDGYCNRQDILDCVHPLWDCSECEYWIYTKGGK